VKQLTATGQTVEEAVKSALAQLQTTKDHTETQVIDKLFSSNTNQPKTQTENKS
jgi:predicted RNA-binding protein Jag